ELNARYQFNDDGEVDKVQARDWQACIERTQVTGDASHYLLPEQAAPWDAEHQPPFKALIIQTPETPILALVLHPILDQTCQANDLYRKIMHTADTPLPWLHRQADIGEN